MNALFSPDAVNLERLEIVETTERLAAIAEPWTQLWLRMDALIFQSHAWVSAWWLTAGKRQHSTLRIGLVWSGETLVAVLPLKIRKRKGVRMLEWAALSYTDYADVLRAPECSQSALENLWAGIWGAGGFDVAFINRLLPDADARSLFDSHNGFKSRLNDKVERSSRISGEWTTGAAWLASHAKKMRQNYRRSVKMLEEAGEVKFRLLGPGEPVAPVLERIALLKRRWLAKNALMSDLFDEGTTTFAALVDAMARAGILRLFVLEVNGTVVAATVNFAQHGAMMAWVTTYDPDFARASPGMVLIFDYTQWSFDNGLQMVDFLCGGEAFKERFATNVVTLAALMRPRTMRGRASVLFDELRHRMKKPEDAKATAPADVA